jgi:hypothetical protein
MTLEIQVLTWDRYRNVAGLNRLMEYQPSLLENWISNSNIYILNIEKYKKKFEIITEFQNWRFNTINIFIPLESTPVKHHIVLF